MKQFLVTCMFLMIIGCNKQEVVITVELPEQPEVNTLIYSVPISGTICLGFSDTLKQSETGKFELKMRITQPSFVTIWDESYSNRVKLLLEPGNNYHVSMKPQKNVQITGTNEKGQMLYTTLPDPGFIELELGQFSGITSLISVHDKINELKQSDMSKFKELLDNKVISKSYYTLIQKDRDCYYASLEARFSTIKAFRQFKNGMEVEDDLLENLKEIYNQYPPNDERLIFSSFWYEYTRDYVTSYKQYVQKDFAQKCNELENAGTINTYYINESKKYLSGKALEFFQATYIHNKCIQDRFEKDLMLLFEQFEKDYPKSEYSKFIRPYIDKIISYYQIVEKPFDPAMLFMDHYETVNTLEEAIKPLLGKKIYIDVWGTWCNPCIKEFAHNDALKKILVENDIQLLYISIRDDDDLKWKNTIKYHHLTGAHIRANWELFLDLEKLYSKNLEHPVVSVPWYILVDEKGNIIEERAKSPSQLVAGEKLFAND